MATASGSPRREGHGRRPRWVYGVGEEPDVRFSFANERTMLAWIRTALALMAAGVAIEHLGLGVSAQLRTPGAVSLMVVGAVASAASWIRWARCERALRLREPLTAPMAGAVVAVATLAIGVVVLLSGR